jgi:hypothetical protein
MCIAAVCCVGSALCCAGAACCKCLCAPCGKAGVHEKNFSRIGYVIFHLMSILVAMLMIKIMTWIMSPGGWDVFDCAALYEDPTLAPKACLGSGSLIRMSWVLACFHAFMVLTILPRGDAAAQWHDGCWSTKALIVVAGWIASQWLPNDPFIEGYM